MVILGIKKGLRITATQVNANAPHVFQ